MILRRSVQDNIDNEGTSSSANDRNGDIAFKTEDHPTDAIATPIKVAVQEGEMEFDELQHHTPISDDKSHKTEEVATERVVNKVDYQGKVISRMSWTFHQKRDILKQYENLPDTMPMKKKAEVLGVKRTTLLKLLADKDKIMSVQNTPNNRMRMRYGKDEEVEKATLNWLQSAMQLGQSYSTITAKASEIAIEMGKDFKPRVGWAYRFCKRHNISVVKDEYVKIIEEE